MKGVSLSLLLDTNNQDNKAFKCKQTLLLLYSKRGYIYYYSTHYTSERV